MAILLVSICYSQPAYSIFSSTPWAMWDSYSMISSPCLDEDGICPPGLFCNKGHCKCGVYPEGSKIVQCDNITGVVTLLEDYCITYEEQNFTSLRCICLAKISDELYYQLPRNATIMNTACYQLNRTGVQCGRCLVGHFYPAYSINLRCFPCLNLQWNRFWFTMAAYAPLTLFCLVLLIFSILCSKIGSTMPNHIFALVYCCQIMSAPFQQRVFL